MTFTITYRGADGAVRTEAVEAANRVGCLAQMRARGISPMSVNERWNGRGKAPNPKADKRPLTVIGDMRAKFPSVTGKVLLLAAALAILAGGVWLWLGCDEAQPHETEPTLHHVVSTGRPSPATTKEKSRATNMLPQKIKMPKSVALVALLKEEAEATGDKGEQEFKPVTHDNGDEAARPAKIARTGAEELLLMVTPAAPGATVPPLPDLGGMDVERSAAEALATPISADDGDSVERLERKAVLSEQKEEFRDLRDGRGWKFRKYVEALMRKANEDSALLTDATKVVEEADADETISDEEFKIIRDKVNETLAKRGIPAIRE